MWWILAAAVSHAIVGGVTDPNQSVALVKSGDRTVAVDLATGQVRWKLDGATPIVATGDLLYAWELEGANVRVVAVTLADGIEMLRSERLPLPDGIDPRPGPGRSFTIRPTLDTSTLRMQWESRTWYVAGKVETAEANRRKTGTVELDLRAGSVRAGTKGDDDGALSIGDAPASAWTAGKRRYEITNGPRRITATDLKSGKQLWSVPLESAGEAR